jgi:hypothetical protein
MLSRPKSWICYWQTASNIDYNYYFDLYGGIYSLLKQVMPLGYGLSGLYYTSFMLKCFIFPRLHYRNLNPWMGTLVVPVQKWSKLDFNF